eukprot:403333731
MRPSSLRRDRQNQYNYMSSEEQKLELDKQVQEKRLLQQQEKVQNQQEILNQYKNYQLGADEYSGENPAFMKDLDQLVQNREREIQRMVGMNMGHIRNEGFQGDMNAFAQGNHGSGPNPSLNLGEKKQFDLFSDNFVQNYGQQQQKNNENMNIINSIFGNANPTPINSNQSNAESERERRLKLRELERMKRQEGFSGGDYGQVQDNIPPPQQQQQQQQSYIQNNIFGDQTQVKPTSAGLSKRDQIWQQKLQQRIGSQEGQRVPLHQPVIVQQNVSQQLPIFQSQGLAPIQNQFDHSPADFQQQNVGSNVRSSRILLQLNDARKLDQSINLETQKQLQQQLQSQPQMQSNPLLGGDDDLIKKRREIEKNERQREYQEFLAKQSGKPQQPQGFELQSNIQTSVPSSSQSNHRPSYRSGSEVIPQQNLDQASVLKQGGLQQLGMKETSIDEKVRKQREYRQQLDLQNQQKMQNQRPPAQVDRKKELSDQVFAEIMSSSKQNFYQPPQNPGFKQQNEVQPMIYNQQAPINVNQYQQDNQKYDPQNNGAVLLRNQMTQDDEKRIALEKKKEYGMQLQQQMALKQQQQTSDKRRRGTSQVHQQNQMLPDQGFQNQFNVQKPVFEYQNPQVQMGFQPPQLALQQNQFQNPYIQQQNIGSFMDQQLGFQQQNPMYNQQPISTSLSPLANGSYGMPSPQQFFNQQMVPPAANNDFRQNIPQTDPQQQAKQKQEDYRRELEMQIKLKEEQKRQEQISQQLYDKKQDKDFAQLLQHDQPGLTKQLPPPNFQQNIDPRFDQQQFALQQQVPQVQAPGSAPSNFVRQRTDLSKHTDQNEDQQKFLKQQQYQEELKRQMDEKNRQKEEEKRKIKFEEEQHERKLQIERELLSQKEHQDLVKEGKRDPNAPYQAMEKKKQVRRDQFEPSAENLDAQQLLAQQNQALAAAKNEEWRKPSEIVAKESLFGNDMGKSPLAGNNFGGFQNQAQPTFELPISNRREDFFGKPPVSSSYDMPPPSYGYKESQMQSQFPQDRFQGYNNPSIGMSQPQASNQSNIADEQSKVIQMYQTALQQILDIKNQFYDQAVQMNDKLIKEREQLLEYEKMKQQQNQEIQSLQAVYHQLGSLLQRPLSSQSNISQQYMQNQGGFQNQILNPQVQNNLNNLIQQQKADIMRLSQSGGFNLSQLQNAQQMKNNGGASDKYQYQLPQIQEETNILEQSLSSDTKFVNIQMNKLTQIAQQHQQQQQQQQQDAQLFQTWKQDQLNQATNLQLHQPGATGLISELKQQTLTQQQQLYNGTMQKSLAGSSHFINQLQGQQTPQKFSNLKPNLPAGLHSRPQTSTLPPETIVEMPKEEDDQVNQSKQGLSFKEQSKKQEEDHDFNSRESSAEKQQQQLAINRVESKNSDNSMATMQQNIITNTNPLGNTTTIQENMLQIDQMLYSQGQKTGGNQNQLQQMQIQQQSAKQGQNLVSPANKTQGHFGNMNAGATGSSFYNQTLVHQKQQEQSQMEELQKQLMRILGNTNDASVQSQGILQQMQQKPATPLLNQQHQQYLRESNQSEFTSQQDQQQQQRISNPLVRASFNEKLNTLAQDEKDLLRQSNINIADSVGGTQQMQEIVQMANKKFSSNGFYTGPPQYDPQIVDETKYQADQSQEFNKVPNQPQKNQFNEQPQFSQNSIKPVQHYEESSQQNNDIWNDPDLIPPPVVMMGNDDEDYFYEPQMNQSQYGQGYNQSMIQDGTLKNLQMFSPPSDENNFNIGGYDNGSQNYDQSQDDRQPYGSVSQQNDYFAQDFGQNDQNQLGLPQTQYYMEKTSGTNVSRPNDLMSERSVTKKERDIKNMMEVAKLIQQATTTTNNLFENSSNFKFKIKRENIKEGPPNSEQTNNKKPLQSQNSRKNIKTNDPFKIAEAKLQNTTTQNNNNKNQSNTQLNQINDQDESNINLADSMGQNQMDLQMKDKDEDILSNLDKMIFNLQAQQQKCANLNPTTQSIQESDEDQDQYQQQQPVSFRGRPISGIPRPSSNLNNDRSKSNKKGGAANRPISAVDGQPQLGKYAQMAQNQMEKHQDTKSQKSQKSLGRFAQMAVGGVDSQQVVQEIKQKYIGDQDSHAKNVMDQLQQIQQQNILRPVSGKSNSTRYAALHHKTNSIGNRGNSANQQQMYYEDESDDYTNQIHQINQQNHNEDYQQQLYSGNDLQQFDDQQQYQDQSNDFNNQVNFGADEDTSRFNIGYEQEMREPEYE